MPPQRRPRVLLAIEPRLLEGAVGDLLEQADHYDVVEYHQHRGTVEPFDVAVVSIDLPVDLHPDVVIRLAEEGRAGEARVERGGDATTVDVASVDDILDLIALESGTSRPAE